LYSTRCKRVRNTVKNMLLIYRYPRGQNYHERSSFAASRIPTELTGENSRVPILARRLRTSSMFGLLSGSNDQHAVARSHIESSNLVSFLASLSVACGLRGCLPSMTSIITSGIFLRSANGSCPERTCVDVRDGKFWLSRTSPSAYRCTYTWNSVMAKA
jgi:hypothetical protein